MAEDSPICPSPQARATELHCSHCFSWHCREMTSAKHHFLCACGLIHLSHNQNSSQDQAVLYYITRARTICHQFAIHSHLSEKLCHLGSNISEAGSQEGGHGGLQAASLLINEACGRTGSSPLPASGHPQRPGKGRLSPLDVRDAGPIQAGRWHQLLREEEWPPVSQTGAAPSGPSCGQSCAKYQCPRWQGSWEKGKARGKERRTKALCHQVPSTMLAACHRASSVALHPPRRW
jgi:hypothetical protein